jgi:AcrR family transcriptional regulator
VNQRARSAEDKVRRTEDLLKAAEVLADELGGARHVTVTAVAQRAGIDPSGMRRYFSSKEELLLELAERGWTRWRELVLAVPGGPDLFSPAETAGVLSRTIAELPLFCDLLTHVPLSLEGDVDMERARRYKINAFTAYDDMARHLEAASVMSSKQVADLITITLALAANLWQVAHPTPTLAALYEQVPRWGHVALEFAGNLTHLLEASAVGIHATGLATPTS